jgi:hypothetical protein
MKLSKAYYAKPSTKRKWNDDIIPREIRMTTSISPWKKFGISRATWYRYGKPATKGEYDDSRFDRGRLGAWTPANTNDLKKFGVSSRRSHQRVLRVLGSELAPLVLANGLSVAAADRILGNPVLLAHATKVLSQHRAKLARK